MAAGEDGNSRWSRSPFGRPSKCYELVDMVMGSLWWGVLFP